MDRKAGTEMAGGAPIVRSPVGSTSRARCKASDVARSAFAGVTARMIALSPCRESIKNVSRLPVRTSTRSDRVASTESSTSNVKHSSGQFHLDV